jgi:hypothetical protein
MKKLSTLLFATFACVVANAQTPSTSDGPYHVSYCSNLAVGDSVINITNDGANPVPPLPGDGYGTSASVPGSICANVYAYNADEQVVSCCSCPVTPNGLVSLSCKNDIASNPLTGGATGAPTAVVVKVVATAPAGGSCNNSALLAGTPTLVPGLVIWGTHLHSNTSAAAGTYGLTETTFVPATLTAAEQARLAYGCNVVANVGSGFGVCASCRLGGLGSVQQ